MKNIKSSGKKFKSGFTLIELLVVVAVIGILASVVVAALNNAKNSSEDKAVATNLHTVVNQAELFFGDNGNSYLPAGGATFSLGPCPSYNASGTDMLSKNKVLNDAIAEAARRGSGNSCYNSSSLWAVAVGLKSNTNSSWCVDNNGAGKQEPFIPSSAIDATTFNCK
jgi:prepilin-type N-terminal cleavage/methylation domain-containing protein